MDEQLPSPKRQRIHHSQHTASATSASLLDVDFDHDTRRVVLLVDLDSFYAAASRIRDPSLIGLPIGIKQKGILATASYEARALGVQKLATVKEAVRKCPELILVNGEDLSFFRKLSNQVWRLVRSTVWGAKVEKQGLDELFCDVTDMIEFNLEHGAGEGNIGKAFFRLDPDDSTKGFTYDSTSLIGHVLPAPSPLTKIESPAARRRRRGFLMATHLAHYIRQQILHQVGLASSAGIAHNKLIAKLMCSKHKPSDQTVFLPTSRGDVMCFLDEYEARSLNGFGGAIVNKLRLALGGESLGHGGTEWMNGGLGLDPQAALQERRGKEPPVPLTVSLCRKAFSLQDLVDLFGIRLGPRLWLLLHGIDDEDVTPAPPFPAQLSVEDTYRGLRGQAILDQLQVLSSSLLRRLEAELVDDDFTAASTHFALKNEAACLPSEHGQEPSSELRGVTVRTYVEQDTNDDAGDGSSSSPSSKSSSHTTSKRIWKRYPLSLRLSIRQGWDHRTSRQTRMPVEIFSSSLPRSTRVTAVVHTLTGLYRSMIASHGDKGQGLNLLNVAALDLAVDKPAPALGSFFAHPAPTATTTTTTTKSTSIDLEIFAQLPADIQRDVARQHGIPLRQLFEAVEDAAASTTADRGLEACVADAAGQRLTGHDGDEQSLLCNHCGQVQSPWLQHDHSIWPVFGLPECFIGN